MSLKNKLSRMKKHLIREEDAEEKKSQPPIIEQEAADLPFLDLWKQNGATMYDIDGDFCLVREKRYPIDHQHGDYTFKDFIRAVDAWQDFAGVHPLSSKGLTHEQMFFFDTETTGLGGGGRKYNLFIRAWEGDRNRGDSDPAFFATTGK